MKIILWWGMLRWCEKDRGGANCCLGEDWYYVATTVAKSSSGWDRVDRIGPCAMVDDVQWGCAAFGAGVEVCNSGGVDYNGEGCWGCGLMMFVGCTAILGL